MANQIRRNFWFPQTLGKLALVAVSFVIQHDVLSMLSLFSERVWENRTPENILLEGPVRIVYEWEFDESLREKMLSRSTVADDETNLGKTQNGQEDKACLHQSSEGTIPNNF
jgi:hypothetical protein